MDYNPASTENQTAEPPLGGTVSSEHPSVLFSGPRKSRSAAEAPACFHDLNLDQVVADLIGTKGAYNLAPYYYLPLDDVDSIQYRHEVMRDLENEKFLDQVRHFEKSMATLREHSARISTLSTIYQKQAWFLELIGFYCQTVIGLADNLSDAPLQSRGLLGFQAYLSSYVESEDFATLRDGIEELKDGLARVRYCLRIEDLSVTVGKPGLEGDYSAEVETVFEKFKHGAVKDHRVRLPNWPDMNQVEAQIIEFVAQLYPETFWRVATFCKAHEDYADSVLLRFEREIQFYVAYLEYIGKLKDAGLAFCYPQLSAQTKEGRCCGTFDLALASKLVRQEQAVVLNDFYLEGAERIFVVSGPNQGGKTTFARMFGQLHCLARLGLPVPGREASLFVSDQVLTHFEKEESVANLRGKLQDDLLRIYAILDTATPQSILILNEIFTSTTIQDATWLSRKVMERIAGMGCLCVWVTFIDELSNFGKETVSMVSAVDPGDRTLRTFKIERREADGLAYALALAEKYGLDSTSLKERIRS